MPARDQCGFTLFELIIVIVLVGLLFLIASWRLLPLRGDAEAAHVATTIGALRSALGLEVTERILEGSLESAAELDRANPMNLLAQVPARYLGEVPSAQGADIPPGSWYYDRSIRQLRYRLRFPQYLAHPPYDTPVELSWQVRLRYVDNDGDGRYNAQADSLRGIALEAMNNPQWPDPEEHIPEVLENS
ncbi:MAG: prepilin-type N-terminal cleavage/methylation domain-containing protein [Wenzhouxiangella sp.]|jgi:prepilin-type N-terminal cleavage/methylation domain-containing protein|nr:prepilin-type N-terminal cleavage/methylation domain-containing protein [Wenzhouxiangella sp.]